MYTKAPDRVRSAGIVLHNDAVLVMFRRRDGREYSTFPGGMVEEGEVPEETVVRELAEETSIEVAVEALLYELHRAGELPREYFYRCTFVQGTPLLGKDSIERTINDPEKNFFEPRWVALSDLGNGIPLFPTEVAAQFFHDLAHGFRDAPMHIEGSTIGG